MIIDNLPDFINVNQIAQRLATLGAEFRKIGGKIVTTSQYPLSQEIISILGTDICSPEIPFMNNEDIQSLLESIDAPKTLLKKNVYSLILGITKGHPVLVAATIRWLSINGWNTNVISSLLSGESIQEAQSETSRLTRKLISNASARDTRSLIYCGSTI